MSEHAQIVVVRISTSARQPAEASVAGIIVRRRWTEDTKGERWNEGDTVVYEKDGAVVVTILNHAEKANSQSWP